MRTLSTMLVFVLTVGCHTGSHSPTDLPTPVLVIDSNHSVLHSYPNTEPYRIGPCLKLFIDAGDYTFEMPEVAKDRPVSEIWIATDGDRSGPFLYVLRWEPGKTRYELSSATLDRSDNSPAFHGFRTGQKWTISISAEYETNKSVSAWYGTIEVR